MFDELKFNREIYEDARRRYGLRDDVVVNGERMSMIPNDPASIVYWFADRLCTPVFSDNGELCDWTVASPEDAVKYAWLACEVSMAHGMGTEVIEQLLAAHLQPDD